VKTIVASLSFAMVVQAQNTAVKNGAEIFRTTCSVAYCHGSEGSAGRAPQLAGTALSVRDLIGIISAGKQSGMPAFGQKLSTAEIESVAQYIRSLPAPTAPAATGAASSPAAAKAPAALQSLSPVHEKGRALFFDAVRMGGCGSCHELENRGSPVGPDLRTVPPGRDLRAGSHGRVVTANAEGEEPFPAIPADRTPQRVRLYDLSSPLPVLRTFQADRVRLTPGSKWSHTSAVRNYSDRDLEMIASYLSALGSGK
jgi:mono/diheme cytochrome c family protein